jgi:hypothetical protein
MSTDDNSLFDGNSHVGITFVTWLKSRSIYNTFSFSVKFQFMHELCNVSVDADCKLKPYVSYAVKDIYQEPVTSKGWELSCPATVAAD